MGVDAKIVEDFVAYTRDKKGQDPVEHQFKAGDKISLSQIWEGDLCLVKNADGKVFNIKKTLLEKEVFEQKAGKEKGKTRRKRSGEIPDFADLTTMRPELSTERGLTPSLAKLLGLKIGGNTRSFFRSKTGASITSIVLILAIYMGWINFQRSRNSTPFAQLAITVLKKGALIEPGHFKPSFHQLHLDYNNKPVEAKVQDSIWGNRILTLKIPGKKSSILASRQEDLWQNNKQLKSVYFNEYVDVGSNGEIDEIRKVLEFRSGSNILVGSYRKTVSSDATHKKLYQESVQQIVRSFAK